MRETFGHYRILEQIGAGGMGVVYRARDEHLERDVAIKVLSTASLPDDESRRRFRREALALSKLNHPNIATIHDFDTFENVDVLVMEHIPGKDLDELLRGGPLPQSEIVAFGRQLTTALDCAHQHGVVHRDLKPGNIRVTTAGLLKVLDFGVARAVQLDAEGTTRSLTDTAFAGTLPYMAPEQVRGGPVDYRTDIYAAGAVLYEMATGSRVYAGLTGGRLLGAILEEPLLPARSLNPRVSPELEAILSKALDKNPALRYQSVRELQVDLERLAAPAKVPDASLPIWRRARPLAFAGLIAIMLGTLVWLAWTRNDPFEGWILVADFEDRTGDPELALVIRDLFTLQLQQSRHLNVLSREQVVDALNRMERRGPEQLDLHTALELAEREAVPMVLAGTAHKRGQTVLVAVSGMDPISREVLFTEATEYDDEADLRRQIGSLATGVRRQLGESSERISENTRPLEEVTTPSTHALKLYSRGAEATRRGDADEARRLLSTALELDPGFAMAHRAIARVYETRGNAVMQRDHLARAYELRERLTQRERLHVEAAYFKGTGEYERAVASLTAVTNLYPGDGEARYELARAYRDAGDSAGGIEQLEVILAKDPLFTSAYGLLVLELARSGNYDRATAVYEQARQRNIGAPQLEWGYGMVLLGRDRLEEARNHFRALEASSRVYAGIARLHLATADVLEGRLEGAKERLQTDIMGDRRSGDLAAEVKRRYLLGQILLLQGNHADAVEQATAMVQTGPERLGANEWRMAGTLFVALAEPGLAADALGQLHQMRTQGASSFVESCHLNLAGEIALAEQRPHDAVQAFNSASAAYPRALTTRGLARAFMTQQDWRRARQVWSQVIDSRGSLLHEGLAADWVLAHLERARASRQMGDVAAARGDYEAFLSRWRQASKLPVLRAAAAEYRALPLNSR